MEVTITKENGITTVHLIGKLDTPASQEVAPQFDELKNDAAGTILLDCTELSYISSSGLRLFLTLRKNAAAQGGRVVIHGLSNDIRSVFMVTGFLNLFDFE